MVRLALNETKVNVYSGNFLKRFVFLNLNQWENKGEDSETVTPKFVLSFFICASHSLLFSLTLKNSLHVLKEKENSEFQCFRSSLVMNGSVYVV